MKKIRCLLPLLLLALFTGCTLMIDEPETATTPQETENGDGITSPRRIVSDMGEVRYQIGPETRMIDKDYLPYLLTYKTDTLDRVTEIYFNKSIPLELLPQRGEFLTYANILPRRATVWQRVCQEPSLCYCLYERTSCQREF